MSVFVGTPAHGPLEPEAAHSFAALMQRLGPDAMWRIEARNPNQPLARNCLGQQFLASGRAHALFIDRDSVFSPEDAIALLEAGEDVTGALCRMKALGSDWVGVPTLPEVRRGPLVEMARIGFGMVAMTRAAVLKMANAVDHVVPEQGDSAGKRVPRLFRESVDPVTLQPIGTDYGFSDRWRELGGQLWVHTGVQIGHVGPHVFR